MEMRNDLLKGYREEVQENNKIMVTKFLDHFKKLNINIFKSNIVVVELERRLSFNGILKVIVDGKTIYKQDNYVLFPELPGQGLYMYLSKHEKADELSNIADILDININYERLNNEREYTYTTGILWWKKEYTETLDLGIERYTIDFSTIK